MSEKRSINFLPEVFKTETNNKFLSGTVDNIISEPNLTIIQGYVGKKTSQPSDYINEINAERKNYQLEPAFIFRNNRTITNALTYPEIVNLLANSGADVTNQSNIFSENYYSYDPQIDLDKFVNYSKYYWVPSGLDAVDVFSDQVPLAIDFVVSRNDSYKFTGVNNKNPEITLVRGGNYKFIVNQPEKNFWIQTELGTSGVSALSNNVSVREIFGVSNNGASVGVVEFNVPSANEQQFFSDLTSIADIGIITDLRFDQIHNVKLSAIIEKYSGLDGIADIENKTVVFSNQFLGWNNLGVFDESGNAYLNPDPALIQPISLASRSNKWRIEFFEPSAGSGTYVRLVEDGNIPVLSKFRILFGMTNSGISYYKTASSFFQRVPLLTAALDTLYYQDGDDSTMFAKINIVDAQTNVILDVNEILTRKEYTSVNGVKFTNGLKVIFRGNVVPSFYKNREFVVEGVGDKITLTPWDKFVIPEPYLLSLNKNWDVEPFDTQGYNESVSNPTNPEYIVINRASMDHNGWSRLNRWYHEDTIALSQSYTGKKSFLFDEEFRAKRPIVEFYKNLQLFNFPRSIPHYVNVVDFEETDAFSNIKGQISYSSDLHPFQNGTTVIFANDPDIKNKVFRVSFEDLNSNGEHVIVFHEIGEVLQNQGVLVTSGVTKKGNVYQFDGESWSESQIKTKPNQYPLFDIVDQNGHSVSTLPESNFAGCSIFNYSVGQGKPDSVLNLSLAYKSLGTFSEILFDNFYNNDQFSTLDGIKNVKNNFIKVNTETGYTLSNTWVKSARELKQYQVVEYPSGGTILFAEFDTVDFVYSDLKVYINDILVNSTEYIVEKIDNQLAIQFDQTKRDFVKIRILSDFIVKDGYFEIPVSMEKNPLNQTPSQFTVGIIRSHYFSSLENIEQLSGSSFGSNNSRDLGNLPQYSTSIIQHESPMFSIVPFLKQDTCNIFWAIDWVSQEYQKIKNRILDAVVKEEWVGFSAHEILDDVLFNLNVGKSEVNSFFWSDMCPTGIPSNVREFNYNIFMGNQIKLGFTPRLSNASHDAVLLYVDDEILLKDRDYLIAEDTLTVLVSLQNNQKVRVVEYNNQSYGSFIPDTPTKLGMYSKFEPKKYIDNTYRDPKTVILGHDGSITVAFDDIRDDVLLEFEKRIYNNLKISKNNDLDFEDVNSGIFRNTGFDQKFLESFIAGQFVEWSAKNRIDFKLQDYEENDPFTWNYSGSISSVTGKKLKGNWRGIFFDLYDTDIPHLEPWRMIGLSTKPTWWDTTYGEFPYTSGNTPLWDDLENGIIRDPSGPIVNNKFKRVGLKSFLPVNDFGQLKNPFEFLVRTYTDGSFKKSWSSSDYSPTETAWRRSSEWPFLVQKILAMYKPVRFAGFYLDADDIKLDPITQQYFNKNNERISLTTFDCERYPRHSFTNWVEDFSKYVGNANNGDLKRLVDSVTVQLAYRIGGFTDKNFIRVVSDSVSPSSGRSLIIPKESYSLHFQKNSIFSRKTYSAINIQRVTNGYAVSGYNEMDSFFRIKQPIINASFRKIERGQLSATVSRDFSVSESIIPYGTVFSGINGLANFLIGYGLQLESQGFVFENYENEEINWDFMVLETAQWIAQNWPVDSVLSLNPFYQEVELNYLFGTSDSIDSVLPRNLILSQNKQKILVKDLEVTRTDNKIRVKTLTNDLISYINFNLISVEHCLVFENESDFGDIIYEPVTGSRIKRLKISGYKTKDWNGNFKTDGFIVNFDNIQDWVENTKYTKGEIVRFKNKFWSAKENLAPSEKFEYNEWIPSDIEKVGIGLLPNPAAKAKFSENYYSVNGVNFEKDADLFSLGLIGFRPREYFSNLGLDDVSQIKLYQNLVKNKGTLSSAELLNQGRFLDPNTIEKLSVYENWAILRQYYGATGNRKFIDIELNSPLLTGSPSIVSLVDSMNEKDGDQNVLVSEIFDSSIQITDKNVFSTFSPVSHRELPTSGFVRGDEVDIRIYDLNQISEIKENLEKVQEGTVLWVAKTNRNDWGIFKTRILELTVTRVQDGLDGESVVTTSLPHGLKTNQYVVIKDFNSEIDGVFNVIEVLSNTTFSIEFSFTGRKTFETGSGSLFIIENSKVDQPSSIESKQIDVIRNQKYWVEEDESGVSSVWEKKRVFDFDASVLNTSNTTNTYGSSVAVSPSGKTIAVGDSNRATVELWEKNNNVWQLINTIVPDNIQLNASNFGHRVAFGSDNTLAVSSIGGQHGGLVFVYQSEDWSVIDETQYIYDSILPEFSKFGDNIAFSRDDFSLFISAPGVNRVYSLVKIGNEYAGESILYNESLGFGKTIAASRDGNTLYVGCPDATVGSCNYAGKVLVFTKKSRRYYIDSIPFSISVPFEVKRILKNGTTVISGLSEAQVGDIIDIESNDFDLQNVVELVSSKPRYDSRFGSSIALSRTASNVFIGSPKYTKLAVYSGAVERFVVSSKILGTIESMNIIEMLPSGNLLINNQYFEFSGGSLSDLVAQINNKKLVNVFASEFMNKLVISIKNREEAQINNQLVVYPAGGNLYSALGLQMHTNDQFIIDPNPDECTEFGATLAYSDEFSTLFIGSPASDSFKITDFDSRATDFDNNATVFADKIDKSGVVYTYQLLPDRKSNSKFGKLVIAEQVVPADLVNGDNYGSSLAYNSNVFVSGSPTATLYERDGVFYTRKNARLQIANENFILEKFDTIEPTEWGFTVVQHTGRIVIFKNSTGVKSWVSTSNRGAVVDQRTINSVNLYDKNTFNVVTDLDWIDPIQGKILGAAQQNIDFISSLDPAVYDIGQEWGELQEGKIWWHTENVRFIDYYRDNAEINSTKWSQVFEGSSVDIYRWTSTNIPPDLFQGNIAFPEKVIERDVLNDFNIYEKRYFFWEKNSSTIDLKNGKTLSPIMISRYISDPQSSGIPYAAFVTPNSVALYNCATIIKTNEIILHIDFEEKLTEDNIHAEYELFSEGKKDSFVSDDIFTYMVDSFVGQDQNGVLLPHSYLSKNAKWGVGYGKSLFKNRLIALKTFFNFVNTQLKLSPVAEFSDFRLLSEKEPIPRAESGEWDKLLNNLDELSFQNYLQDGIGYRYLVLDSGQGEWAIFEIDSNLIPKIIRTQNFDNRRYWELMDWYKSDFPKSSKIDRMVIRFEELNRFDPYFNLTVKVKENAQGKWEIYRYNTDGWERVALEKGTIQFSNSLWENNEFIPELRGLINGVVKELFVNDLFELNNKWVSLIFEYILTENIGVNWLFKTSLVDVENKINRFGKYESFKPDQQENLLQYFNESKPYRTKLKEFYTSYQQIVPVNLDVTDFDSPPYFDRLVGKIISPILGSNSGASWKPENDIIWQTKPWNEWFNNRGLHITEVLIADGGSDYFVPPTITVNGVSVTQSKLRAVVDSNTGKIVSVIVEDSGSGYLATPTIEIESELGQGGKLIPVMKPEFVRDFSLAVKYDRIDYSPTVSDWKPNTVYVAGDMVRYLGKVFRALVDQPLVDSIDLDFYEEVDITEFSASNRTYGYYSPGPNQPGRNLSELIPGTDYEEIIMRGLKFIPERNPLVLSNFDVIYNGKFTDSEYDNGEYTVITDGGSFVDVFSSHAPEELSPGACYDTVIMKVKVDENSIPATTTEVFSVESSNTFVFSSPLVGSSFVDMVVDLDGIVLTPPSVNTYRYQSGMVIAIPDYNSQVTLDILVFVDEEKLLSSDYVVDNGTIIFNQPVAVDSTIRVINFSTSDYEVDEQSLTIDPSLLPLSNLLTITIFNYPSEYRFNVFTIDQFDEEQVEIPEYFGVYKFDSEGFDFINTENIVSDVIIDLSDINFTNIIVTKNKIRQFENFDFAIVDSNLVFFNKFTVNDKLTVRTYTDNLTTSENDLIFVKDKMNSYRTHRIVLVNLVEDISDNSDEIELTSLNGIYIPEPGIFGEVLIGSEIIRYRAVDEFDYKLLDIVRGARGTAMQDHKSGDNVYNLTETEIGGLVTDFIEVEDGFVLVDRFGNPVEFESMDKKDKYPRPPAQPGYFAIYDKKLEYL